MYMHMAPEKFAFGTQCNLYSTDLRLGLVSGVTQNLGLASGVKQIFRVFRYQHVGIPNVKNYGVGSLDQCKAQMRKFCVAVEYRLN